MLLEQILRRQAQFHHDLKEKLMTTVSQKLVTIGVQVPGDIHLRMSQYLAKSKADKTQPQSLKALAVLCINLGLKQLETA